MTVYTGSRCKLQYYAGLAVYYESVVQGIWLNDTYSIKSCSSSSMIFRSFVWLLMWVITSSSAVTFICVHEITINPAAQLTWKPFRPSWILLKRRCHRSSFVQNSRNTLLTLWNNNFMRYFTHRWSLRAWLNHTHRRTASRCRDQDKSATYRTICWAQLHAVRWGKRWDV